MTCSGGVFDVDTDLTKIAELETITAEPDFWQDQAKAQEVMRQLTRLRQGVAIWETIGKHLHETIELVQLGDEELYEDLARETELLTRRVNELEFRTLFSGEYDDEKAIFAIHAGGGGTESQDWAQLLQRMYLRWAETHGFTTEILDESPGDEAGINSVLLSVEGDYVYGRLKSERGVHRLVRISPYDASSRRHTSF